MFVGPLLASSQHEYDSALTQAIGRARRFGQQNIVKIYHFLSLHTIDIQIIEDRSQKKAVFRIGTESLDMVAETDLTDVEKQQNWRPATGSVVNRLIGPQTFQLPDGGSDDPEHK